MDRWNTGKMGKLGKYVYWVKALATGCHVAF